MEASCVLPQPPQQHEAKSLMRHLAHELRQPLSTIESIAYYLQMVLPAHEDKALQQVDKLQELVEQANGILADAVYLLQAAVLRPALFELNEVVIDCVEDPSFPQTKRFSLDLAEELPPVRLDPCQGEHLIRSILMAALSHSTTDQAIPVRTSAGPHGASLEVLCSDAQLAEGDLRSMMEPFCHRLRGQSSLSLASARRIAEVHGGSVQIQRCELGGFSIRVTLPAA